MRSVKSLLGLPVRVVMRDEPLGSVGDVCVDPGHMRLAALLVAKNGLVRTTQMVYWQDVQRAEADSIYIESEGMLRPMSELPGDWWSTHRDPGVWGRRLYAATGDQLGLIGDLWIDAKGAIVGCNVSDGVLRDLVEGQTSLMAKVRLHGDGESLSLVTESNAVQA